METQEQSTNTHTATHTATGGKGTKFFAGVGVVALIIAAAWLGVQALQFGNGITAGIANSLSGFGNFFGNDEELVLAATPSIVESEQEFTLSWEHAQKETDGSYTFSYNCVDGVYLTSPASANVGEVVFCNTPFNILHATNTLTLKAIADSDESINIPLEIHFTPNENDDPTARGETRITVVLEAPEDTDVAGAATTTPNQSSDEDGTGQAPEGAGAPIQQTGRTVVVSGDLTPFNDPNGTPDLMVSILEVGTVTESGIFTPQTGALDPDDRLAVRFAVENLGTKDTGAWRFEARLPTERSYTFNSDLQETLLPGVRVEYILGFEETEDDDETGTIRIELDPDDDVNELSENNNDDSITIEIED